MNTPIRSGEYPWNMTNAKKVKNIPGFDWPMVTFRVDTRGGFMDYMEHYHKEPIILEPEDWTEDEWKTILKLFGLERAEGIALSNYEISAYGERIKDEQAD